MWQVTSGVLQPHFRVALLFPKFFEQIAPHRGFNLHAAMRKSFVAALGIHREGLKGSNAISSQAARQSASMSRSTGRATA